MHFLGKLSLILSLCALAAFGREKGKESDTLSIAGAPSATQISNPRDTNKENKVLIDSLLKVQTDLKGLIAALGYTEDFKKAKNIEEFLKQHPDFASDALVALGRDYNANDALSRTEMLKAGVFTGAMIYFMPASYDYLGYLLHLYLAKGLADYSRAKPKTAEEFDYFYSKTYGLATALSSFITVGTMVATYHFINSTALNELIYGKSIELNSKIPLTSLAETKSFVTCYLGSHEGPWVWLQDSQGNSIPGVWGKTGWTASWSFATLESPISLKTRCGEALRKAHPEKDKISPKDVLVVASTRSNIYPIEFYVGMGDSAYRLYDILTKDK